MRRLAVLVSVLAVVALPVAARAPVAARQASPASGGPAPPPSPPLLAVATVAVPPTPAFVGLWRSGFAAGVARPAAAEALTTLTYVEAGALTVRALGPATVLRAAPAGTPAAPASAAPGTDVVLGPGDAIGIPAGTPFALRAPGPTTILVAGLGPATAAPPFFDPVFDAAALPVGVTVEPLAAGAFLALPPGPVAVTLLRAAVAPGAEEPADTPAGPRLTYVAAGTLGYALASGGAQIGRVVGPGTPSATGPAMAVAPGAEVILRAGDAVVEEDDVVRRLRNAGDEPAVHLVVFVWPAGFFAPPPEGTPAAATPVA